MAAPCPPVLVDVVRDGAVESAHRGWVAVVDADGTLVQRIGGTPVVYPRSTLKPFQAAAVLDLLADCGVEVSAEGVAIACASHTGSDDHAIEAAHLLALAGVDEGALRCPTALPADEAALLRSDGATRIAHNCSGKHAAFLLAQVAVGADPARYLDPHSAVQRRVAERIAAVAGATPLGPGVDGCGAPAWRLPLVALARGFVRFVTARQGPLARVAAAMRGRPDLVGGHDAPDSLLMRADRRIVAKRGAEGAFAAAAPGPDGPFGVAVAIEDGGGRAAAAVAAALLRAAGLRVPDAVVAPPVLGGGRPHGALTVRADALGGGA